MLLSYCYLKNAVSHIGALYYYDVQKKPITQKENKYPSSNNIFFRAIEQLGGLEQESDYPYEGADDKCVFNKTLSKVQISSAVNISSNETDMAKWLVHNGPISIGEFNIFI